MINLKQPLSLADNLSAFDPEIPLTLSDSLGNSLALPLADMSAVSNLRTGRGKLVHGVSRRLKDNTVLDISNVETINIEFDSSGETDFVTFSQEVWPVFAWLTAVAGTAYGKWLITYIPPRIGQTFNVEEPVYIIRRGTSYYFSVTGTFRTARIDVYGFY